MSPCARACWRAVSQLLCVPCSSPPPPPPPPPRQDTKFVSRYNSCRVLCRARCCACRSVPVLCRRALLRCIAAPGTLCRDTRPAPPVTIQPFVSRHTPTAKPCVRATAHPARRLTVSQGLLVVSWGRVIGLLAVSWPPTAGPYAPVS